MRTNGLSFRGQMEFLCGQMDIFNEQQKQKFYATLRWHKFTDFSSVTLWNVFWENDILLNVL